MKPKCKVINVGLWNWEGMIYAGGKPFQWRDHVKNTMGVEPEISEHARGHAFLKEGLPWSIWLESIDQIGTLAHEALHITAGLLESRGLKFCTESEEAYAYTLAAIVDQALDKRGWKVVK